MKKIMQHHCSLAKCSENHSWTLCHAYEEDYDLTERSEHKPENTNCWQGENREFGNPYIVGRNIKWCSHTSEYFGVFLINKTVLSYVSGVLHVRIYLNY